MGDSRVTPTPTSKAGGYILEPPEGLDAAIIYLLYRGAIGEAQRVPAFRWFDNAARSQPPLLKREPMQFVGALKLKQTRSAS